MGYKSKKKRLAYAAKWRLAHPNYMAAYGKRYYAKYCKKRK